MNRKRKNPTDESPPEETKTSKNDNDAQGQEEGDNDNEEQKTKRMKVQESNEKKPLCFLNVKEAQARLDKETEWLKDCKDDFFQLLDSIELSNLEDAQTKIYSALQRLLHLKGGQRRIISALESSTDALDACARAHYKARQALHNQQCLVHQLQCELRHHQEHPITKFFTLNKLIQQLEQQQQQQQKQKSSNESKEKDAMEVEKGPPDVQQKEQQKQSGEKTMTSVLLEKRLFNVLQKQHSQVMDIEKKDEGDDNKTVQAATKPDSEQQQDNKDDGIVRDQYKEMIQYLVDELNQRGRLQRTVETTRQTVERLRSEWESSIKAWKEVPKKLDSLERATQPLQTYFFPSTGNNNNNKNDNATASNNHPHLLTSERRKRLQWAATALPGPLYQLFTQFQTFIDQQQSSQSLESKTGPSALQKISLELSNRRKKVLHLFVPCLDIWANGSKKSKSKKTHGINIEFNHRQVSQVVTARAFGHIVGNNRKWSMGMLNELFPRDNGQLVWINEGDDDDDDNDDNDNDERINEDDAKVAAVAVESEGCDIECKKIKAGTARPYHWCNYLAGYAFCSHEAETTKTAALYSSTSIVMHRLQDRVYNLGILAQFLTSLLTTTNGGNSEGKLPPLQQERQQHDDNKNTDAGNKSSIENTNHEELKKIFANHQAQFKVVQCIAIASATKNVSHTNNKEEQEEDVDDDDDNCQTYHLSLQERSDNKNKKKNQFAKQQKEAQKEKSPRTFDLHVTVNHCHYPNQSPIWKFVSPSNSTGEQPNVPLYNEEWGRIERHVNTRTLETMLFDTTSSSPLDFSNVDGDDNDGNRNHNRAWLFSFQLHAILQQISRL